jgi:hypothetical protein
MTGRQGRQLWISHLEYRLRHLGELHRYLETLDDTDPRFVKLQAKGTAICCECLDGTIDLYPEDTECDPAPGYSGNPDTFLTSYIELWCRIAEEREAQRGDKRRDNDRKIG